VGEHQMNNIALFSMQHSSENTALRMENTAILVACIAFPNCQNEQFIDQK